MNRHLVARLRTTIEDGGPTLYCEIKDGERYKPIAVRTSAGLRDALFDELDRVRAGTSNPTCANAVAKLASGVIESVRMELCGERRRPRRL